MVIANGHWPQILSGKSSEFTLGSCARDREFSHTGLACCSAGATFALNELRVGIQATSPPRECVEISGTDYPSPILSPQGINVQVKRPGNTLAFLVLNYIAIGGATPEGSIRSRRSPA
jgi:hypothetical protein